MADFHRCVELISSATGLLVTAGARMGVDSGLPDFRGNDGLWNHYPALGKQEKHYTSKKIAKKCRLSYYPECEFILRVFTTLH